MLDIYKASAGSGKTFTLTQKYLQLLLGEYNAETDSWRLRSGTEKAHRHILAITFTNKATQEMTRRIIKQLAILAGREPGAGKSDYLDDFAELFGVAPATIEERASLLLDDLLYDFAFFHVSTIDAFFQNVLRVFAREVELPDDFELELDNKYAVNIGVAEMLTSINYRMPNDEERLQQRRWLHQWLERFMNAQLNEGKSVNMFSRTSGVFNSLVTTFNALLNEDYKIRANEIAEYIKDTTKLFEFEQRLDNVKREWLRALQRKAKQIVEYGDFSLTCIDAKTHKEKYVNINRNVVPHILDLAQGKVRDTLPATIVNAASADEELKIKSRYTAAYKKAGVDSNLDAALDRLLPDYVGFQQYLSLQSKLQGGIYNLGLLGCLIRYLGEYCKDNNLILLSDTNTILKDIINDDDTPFVYERLGYILRNFLIDEFQDTSKMQWEIMRPLLHESLSYGNKDLIIGDEKQCIYRFRNSDPELLGSKVEQDVKALHGPDSAQVSGVAITQNKNWRSALEVVTFNNTLFRALAKEIDLAISGGSDDVLKASDVYTTVTQMLDKRRMDYHGHVKLAFFDKKSIEGKADDGDDTKVNTLTLPHVLTAVDELLTRGYRPKDIAILVRTHKEGEAVINYLMPIFNDSSRWSHGKVDVTSSDSLSVSASPTVRMVVDLLRLTLMPSTVKDRQGQEVINPEYIQTRMTQLYEYFRHVAEVQAADSGDEAEAEDVCSRALRQASNVISESQSYPLEQQTKFIEARLHEMAGDRGVNDLNDGRFHSTSLDAVVERLIASFVSDQALKRDTIYLVAFQDLVQDFSARNNGDIRSFLEWWDRSGCNTGLAATSDTDAITVMTIHQSKGLEFPCVIIPYSDWKMVNYHKPSRPSYGWYDVNPGLIPNTMLADDDVRYIPADIIPKVLPLEFTSNLKDMDVFRVQAADTACRQAVDNLNVAYVAFTRAVSELYVFSCPDEPKGAESTSLGQFMRQAVEKSTTGADVEAEVKPWLIDLPAYKVGDSDVYEIGTPTYRKDTIKEKADAEKPDEYIPPTYEPARSDRLTTLSQDDFEIFDFDNPRHRGLFLHRVMSRVGHRSDLEMALKRAVYRAHLTKEQAQWCGEQLSRIFADERVTPWFEGYDRIANERTIFTGDIERRPDRIVWKADGTIDVIDYKFGEEKKSYSKQVKRYVELLEKAGFERVHGYLWYPLNDSANNIQKVI